MMNLLKCPKCENLHIQKYGYYITNKGQKQKYKCASCGHVWSKK